MMTDIGDITITLTLDHRLIGGARLQIMVTDQFHVFTLDAGYRCRCRSEYRRRRGDQRQTQLQSEKMTCHANSPRDEIEFTQQRRAYFFMVNAGSQIEV